MTVTKNADGTVNCIPPWSIWELNEHLDFEWWIDVDGNFVVREEQR